MGNELSKDDIEEIKEFLVAETKENSKDVKIIFDGRQHSIRIPREFADTLDIDTKKDKFRFLLQIPPYTEKNNRPKLKGELIRG